MRGFRGTRELGEVGADEEGGEGKEELSKAETGSVLNDRDDVIS